MSVDVTPFAAEYPFAPHYLTLGNVKLHYVDEGEGDPVLFVHGNPTWSFAWRNLIKGLSPTARCVAIDHIGCGRSDKPQSYNYRLGQHIDNLLALIDSLSLKKITLVGHDWGGCIGMGAAVERPELFDRIVLMNTSAFRSQLMPVRIAACRIPLLGALGVRGFNLFAKMALTMAVEKPEVMTPTVRAGFIAPYNSWANRVAVHRFVEDIPLRPSHPSYDRLVQVESGLERLKDKPMQLIWGTRDWCFTPAFCDEFEARFPQAKTLRLDTAGHYVFEDERDIVLQTISEFRQQN
ncbi:MAG: alpha/beta fold hydrolase [Planctomycetaceae bacterium]